MILDVIPGYSLNDIINGCWVGVERIAKESYRFPLRMKCTYFQNLSFRQFGISPTRNSRTSRLATFANHVVNIIELSAQKQMLGVTAAWIVARVQDVFTFGNRAVRQKPGGAVGVTSFPIICKCTISIWKAIFHPGPTRIGTSRFIHASLESLFRRERPTAANALPHYLAHLLSCKVLSPSRHTEIIA